jgi:hypothetical protein
VRRGFFRTTAVAAAAALTLAACGEDNDEQALPDDEEAADELEDLDEDALDDMLGDQEDMEDPNEDVEDGVYAGNGVILPVPDGWSIDPTAFQQGLVAAMSEDGAQQLTAQAIDVAEAEEMGQPMDLDTLLDGVREQVGQDADVDEEVELEGADRAHRLTYTDLPAQQEGAPESSATLILAEDGNGLIGEFAFSAAADQYDSSFEDLLLETAGFDPDSEPPEPMMQQPPPEGEMSPEDMEELEEMFEDEG